MVIVMDINRLRELREDRDLTQADVAKILKTTQQQYSKYELGIRLIPVEKLMTLALFYNTSMDYLLGKTDIRKPYPPSVYLKERSKEKKKVHN